MRSEKSEQDFLASDERAHKGSSLDYEAYALCTCWTILHKVSKLTRVIHSLPFKLWVIAAHRSSVPLLSDVVRCADRPGRETDIRHCGPDLDFGRTKRRKLTRASVVLKLAE